MKYMQTAEISSVKSKLQVKESRLNGIHQIITPEDGLPVELQAKWMIKLLQFMYTEHGISRSPQKLMLSIESGNCRCWFILERNEPVAMSALVLQSDGSVELGRAVAISPGLGLGGIAMMRAGLDQIERGSTPLVAEVRVADKFRGIPSGEATQKILFGDFGLTPHALVPMFGHGNPFREEMFALATSQNRADSEGSFIPENKAASKLLQAAMKLSNNIFAGRVRSHNSDRLNLGFDLVQTEPFALVLPSRNGNKLETTEKASFKESKFALLPIELSPENTDLILGCLEAGWVPCGVDRNLGGKGHPVLLLGKLKEGTLLAPIKIGRDLGKQNTGALTRIDGLFR